MADTSTIPPIVMYAGRPPPPNVLLRDVHKCFYILSPYSNTSPARPLPIRATVPVTAGKIATPRKNHSHFAVGNKDFSVCHVEDDDIYFHFTLNLFIARRNFLYCAEK